VNEFFSFIGADHTDKFTIQGNFEIVERINAGEINSRGHTKRAADFGDL